MEYIHKISLPILMASAEAQLLLSILGSSGKPARFVGGCVRDAILGTTANDIDIATPLIPEAVTLALQPHGITIIPTGIKHGTVTALFNGKHFEITTLRRDIECYGRHAKVEYTNNFEEDAARRDFTINAMYSDGAGNVHDYFGGYEDLQRGIIRFVGNASDRIQEDALRILRFFRFYARFGKPPMHMEALTAISHHIGLLSTLSGERIQKEMFGLLDVPRPGTILEIMADIRALLSIALPCRKFNAFQELIMLETQLSLIPHKLQRLAILLRTCQELPDVTKGLANRWKLSNRDHETLTQLVELPSKISEELPIKLQKSYLRNWGKSLFTNAVIIAWAEFLAKEQPSKTKLDPTFAHMLRLAEEWNIPTFPLQGRDLLSLGIPAGKPMGILLKKAETWWEEKDYNPTAQEILNYVKTIA